MDPAKNKEETKMATRNPVTRQEVYRDGVFMVSRIGEQMVVIF